MIYRGLFCLHSILIKNGMINDNRGIGEQCLSLFSVPSQSYPTCKYGPDTLYGVLIQPLSTFVKYKVK